MSATIQAMATGLAHEVVLTMGAGDPDDAGAQVAQVHRRDLRAVLLLAIADYLQGVAA
jgi:type IV secretory pathway ATPase VirB11/archaellum biosynthesis ATPase